MRIASHEWPLVVFAFMVGVLWSFVAWLVVVQEPALHADPASWLLVLVMAPALPTVLAGGWLYEHGLPVYVVGTVITGVVGALLAAGLVALMRRAGA